MAKYEFELDFDKIKKQIEEVPYSVIWIATFVVWISSFIIDARLIYLVAALIYAAIIYAAFKVHLQKSFGKLLLLSAIISLLVMLHFVFKSESQVYGQDGDSAATINAITNMMNSMQ